MIFVVDNLTLVLCSFIIFRIFDIFKPWPASYADKKMGGGLGVMLDDVFAGIYAAILIYLIRYII
jgi:phosphatidylglycerophosphatase A